MVVRLTNAMTHVDIAVVHLRVPGGAEALAKQREQNRALLGWSMRHLAKNPKANIMIMGDFNEGRPPRRAQELLGRHLPQPERRTCAASSGGIFGS